MGRWSRSVEGQLGTIQAQVEGVVLDSLLELTESLIDNSVVGDPSQWEYSQKPPRGYKPGHYKHNWQLSTSPSVDEIPGVDPSGERAKTRAKYFVDSNRSPNIFRRVFRRLFPQNFYVSNAVPYAKVLEDGHSGRMPDGNMSLRVSDFPAMFRRAQQ